MCARRPFPWAVLVAVAATLPATRAAAAERGAGGTVADVQVLLSPRQPRSGEPIRVLAGRLGELAGSRFVVADARGPVEPERVVLGEGPTAILAAWLPPLAEGTLDVRVLAADGLELARVSTTVVPATTPRPSPYARGPGLWPIEGEWDARHEVLFSAWIASTFRVEPGAHAAWNPLHEALRDPARNVLFDHLGLGEDSGRRGNRIELLADCADTLYALRAYFAWKMRLPFLAHACSRGTPRNGPTCMGTISNRRSAGRFGRDEVLRFVRFISFLGRSVVHAGTTRTLPDDPESDFYPVALERASLRPGTVYVDAAGHVLMVSQWASPAPGRFGALYAIDGHPDTSVTHKRFTPSWFPAYPVTTDGFKAFRPALLDGEVVRPMTFDEIRARPWLVPPSMEPARLSPDAFYARMAAIQNPTPVGVEEAIRGAVERLRAAANARVAAVEALAPRDWPTLPEHPFSGLGAPAAWRRVAPLRRDLELLVALEDTRLLPWRLTHEPGLVRGAPETDAVRVALARALRAETLTYRRSDGSPATLPLQALVEREEALAYGYHPGDCPEARWGAPGGSDERATCAGEVEPSRQRPLRRWIADVLRRHRDPSGL